MKQAQRLKHLVRAHFEDFFDNADSIKPWEAFVQGAAVPAGEFLVIVKCKCGCARPMHYKIQAVELVYKPGERFARHEFRYQLSVALPGTAEHVPVVVNPDWITKPTMVTAIEVDHEFFDATVGELINVMERKAR